MNIFQRIASRIVDQIERENNETSVNTARKFVAELPGWMKGTPINQRVPTGTTAPDWEAIADELGAAVACAIDGNAGWLDMGIEALNKYHAAKQVKP